MIPLWLEIGWLLSLSFGQAFLAIAVLWLQRMLTETERHIETGELFETRKDFRHKASLDKHTELLNDHGHLITRHRERIDHLELVIEERRSREHEFILAMQRAAQDLVQDRVADEDLDISERPQPPQEAR